MLRYWVSWLRNRFDKSLRCPQCGDYNGETDDCPTCRLWLERELFNREW